MAPSRSWRWNTRRCTNCRASDELTAYEKDVRSGPIAKDLKRVRNVKPLWSKFGTLGGVALGGLSGSLSAQESTRVRLGLIGMGGRGNSLMGNFLHMPDQVEIRAVCDIYPERAKAAQERAAKRLAEDRSRQDIDFARAKAALERALVRIRLVQM